MISSSGFGVFRVSHLGFRTTCSGFGDFPVCGFHGAGFWVQCFRGFALGVQGFAVFRVSRFGVSR